MRGSLKRAWAGACLASALLSAPAWATDYFLDASGGSDSNTGLTGSPWQHVSWANSHLPSGARIILAAGDYGTTQISPVNPSTTWLGDTVTCRNVKVGGVHLDAGGGLSKTVQNTVIYGLYMDTGGITVRAYTQYSGNADGFLVRKCTIEQGVESYAVKSSFMWDSIGTGKRRSYFILANPADFRQGPLSGGCQVSDCVMYLREDTPNCNVDDFLYAIRTTVPDEWHLTCAQKGAYSITGFQQWRNKITLTSDYGTQIHKMTMWGGVKYMDSHDNNITFRDSTGQSGATAQSFLNRDGLQFNTHVRDTVTMHTLIAGHGTADAKMESPGERCVGDHNVWRLCYFKSDVPVNADAISSFAYDWQIQDGDSLAYCVFACSTTVANPFNIHNAVGTSYVYHNTFMNLGGGGAMWIGRNSAVASDFTGTVNFVGNIFYTRSTSATDYGAQMFWPTTGGSNIRSDYNLYAHYGGAGQSLLAGPIGSGGTTFAPGPTTPICLTIGNECHSIYGSPRFTDSTWANFTGALGAGSAALGAMADGSNIGAWQGAPGGGDTTPPAAVSDLTAVAASPAFVGLSWTAPGDDGNSGTATSYDIRYSTSPITEANFSSGTSISAPTPSAAGTATYLSVGGLSSGSTYYFAIKTTDDASNVSRISNVASVSTYTSPGLPTLAP